MSTIAVEFTGEAKPLLGTIESVNATVRRMQGVFTGGAVALGSFGAAGALAGAAYGQLRATIDQGSDLAKLSRATGQSVGDLVLLQRVFKLAGIGADSLQPALRGLARSLAGVNEEGEPTNAVLKRMGVNVEALQTQGAVDQFRALARAILALPSSTERLGAVQKIFGRAGSDLLPVLQDLADDKGFEKTKTSAAELGGFMEKNADGFRQLNRDIAGVESKYDQFKASVVRGLIEGQNETGKLTEKSEGLVRTLNGINVTRMGGQLGGAINTYLNVLARVPNLLSAWNLYNRLTEPKNSPPASTGVPATAAVAKPPDAPVDEAFERAVAAARERVGTGYDDLQAEEKKAARAAMKPTDRREAILGDVMYDNEGKVDRQIETFEGKLQNGNISDQELVFYAKLLDTKRELLALNTAIATQDKTEARERETAAAAAAERAGRLAAYEKTSGLDAEALGIRLNPIPGVGENQRRLREIDAEKRRDRYTEEGVSAGETREEATRRAATRVNMEDELSARQREIEAARNPAGVTSLQRINGGAAGNGGQGNPLLDENRRQTRTLEGLRADINRLFQDRPQASSPFRGGVFQ